MSAGQEPDPIEAYAHLLPVRPGIAWAGPVVFCETWAEAMARLGHARSSALAADGAGVLPGDNEWKVRARSYLAQASALRSAGGAR